jgi:hypothetical protein
MRLQILFFTIVLFCCCKGEKQKEETSPSSQNKKDIQITVYKLEDSTNFGYDILTNGKLYIHQPHIPAINSLKGFHSESDAKKTAQCMADKIERGVSPPSVAIEELDSLGIQY